ncbi:MAG: hypothetical protein V7K81_20780 [Nostoc sp.]
MRSGENNSLYIFDIFSLLVYNTTHLFIIRCPLLSCQCPMPNAQ